MSDRRDGGRGERAAFTLIETLAVFLAIGLIAFLAAARFGSALAPVRLAGAARHVSGSLLEAREAALTTGRTVIVEWGGESSGRYGFRRAPASDAADGTGAWTPVELPDGCRFAGGGRILFFPDGSCDGTSVTVVHESGRSVTIELHPALGLPSASPATAGRAHRVLRARPE